MDESLLGRAVEFHGPDFLRQVQLEQEHIPPNIFLHLQSHRPQTPEISDPQFVLNVRRYIAKKADILFRPLDPLDKKKPDPADDEDSFAKMPPIETFMGIDPHTCRKHLYSSLELGDIVVGVVTSIVDSGLVIQLLCFDETKNRDIDDLHINAFVPSKDIPKMFPTQNPVEGYQVKDYIRGVVVNVNVESESVLVSLMETAIQDSWGTKPALGLIYAEDFPVQYRRKLHIRGLTFDELVNSILGFSNPGNVPYLLSSLRQKQESSLMRGMYCLKIPEKEYAENLKKQQSQKWAYQCVAEGVAYFKEGRQTEAMQKLNKALQIDNSNAEALVARGALYANTESYARALSDFEEALASNPKHPNAIKYMHETLLAKGKSHEDKQEYDEAGKCYKRALEVMPHSQEAKESLRYVQYKEDRVKGAVKKEKSRSPMTYEDQSLPYKETTDTLKKLIRDEQRSVRSRKKESVHSPDDKDRKRSLSAQKKKFRLRSSSSSSSSSRSRSRSQHRKRSPSYEKDREGRKGITKERRSISPNDSESKRSEQYKRDPSSGYYSFSHQDRKIPGLGDSPSMNPEEERKKIERGAMGDEKRYKEEDSDRHSKKAKQMDGRDPYGSSRGSGHGETLVSKEGNNRGHEPEREMSVTPTKDEVSDRLGLEDISPEEHDPRNFDYRLKVYGRQADDDSIFRDYSGKHRSAKTGMFRSPSEHKRRRDRSSSPSEHRRSRRDRSRSPSEHTTSRRGRSRSSSEGRRNRRSRSRSSSRHRVSRRNRSRSSSNHRGRRRERSRSPSYSRGSDKIKGSDKSEENYRNSRYLPKEEQKMDIVQEKRVITVSMPGSRPSNLQEVGSVEMRMEERQSPMTYKGRRPSHELYYDASESQERRSIIIAKPKIDKRSLPLIQSESSTRRSDDREAPVRLSGQKRSRSPSYKSKERLRSQSPYRYKSRSPGENDYSRKRSNRSSNSRSRSPSDRRADAGRLSKGKEMGERTIFITNNENQKNQPKKNDLEDHNEAAEDIFADLPQPKMDNSQIKFATYVPRSVKLKHQSEKGLNQESQLPTFNKESLREEVIKDNAKTSQSHEREMEIGKKDVNDPRFFYRPKTPDGKHRSTRGRSRSSSREREGKRFSKLNRDSRSKRSRSKSRGRSRRSSSRDRYRNSGSGEKSRKSYPGERSRDSKRRGESRSSSSSSSSDRGRHGSRHRSSSKKHRSGIRKSRDKYSRSRSREKRSRSRSGQNPSTSKDTDEANEKSASIGTNMVSLGIQQPGASQLSASEIPNIASRWDSPEEKKSRWEGSQALASLAAVTDKKDIKEDFANYLASYMIAKSPPPHRRMKPEEKKALEEKWKEFNDTEVVEADILKDIVKKRAKEVAERLTEKEKAEMAAKRTAAKLNINKGEKNKRKLMKLQGIKSKWETDSESDSSRSEDERNVGNTKKQDRRSRSRNRSHDSRKGSRSRSRSRDPSQRRRSGQGGSNDRTEEGKVFWFHKKEIEEDKRRKTFKKTFKREFTNIPRSTRWSSDEEKEKQGKKDSLNELEAFYNQLKTEKKQRLSTDATQPAKQ